MFATLNFFAAAIVAATAFIFFTIIFLAKCYRRCPSNRILAVYGKVASGDSVKCYHGGGTFVWPLIQDYDYLDLTPIALHIPLKSALSQQNIRINVPSTFTVAIDTTQEAMNNAAVRLLGLSIKGIEMMATEIITGQLRLTVASLRIEEINQDRERFLMEIRKHIEPELRKIGLMLLNVNITDITDESGYIDSIGKKAASMAINQAKIDVSEQEKRGDIGSAQAERERRIQVSAFNADAVQGENDARAKIASVNADLLERESQASMRGQVAQQQANAEISKAKSHSELARLEAEQIVPKEIEKRKIEIDAAAGAERERIEAEGKAAAILAIKQAEAEGIMKVLNAKADGYKVLVNACGGNPREAATMLLVEKLEEMVKLQTEAIKNLKIDKITVWDSGNNEKGGSSTANFMSNMVKSLPPLHDIAAMSGIDLPAFLGTLGQQNKDDRGNKAS
ncbi:flotillin family protein [Candidatus Dependentiae bacterium]|nr:flotillin family protein [Candidatus Dependentiae bacterium]